MMNNVAIGKLVRQGTLNVVNRTKSLIDPLAPSVIVGAPGTEQIWLKYPSLCEFAKVDIFQ